MKIWLLALSLFLNYFICSGQGRFISKPNDSNKFIAAESINWAAEDYMDSYSFVDSKEIDGENIYDYLLKAQLNRLIRSYVPRDWNYDTSNISFSANGYYGLVIDYVKNDTSNKDLYIDSLKNIGFHQIFYLEDYCLKSHIASASVQYNVFTSEGILLGLSPKSLCCLNDNYKIKNSPNDKVLLLKKFLTVINLDSIGNLNLIKETYKMDLVSSLWYGASLGKFKLFDLKTKIQIEPKDVMRYTIFDSTTSSYYDDTSGVLHTSKVPGPEVFRYFTNSVEFKQDVYYNKTKNCFYTIIDEAYLSVKYMNFEINKEIEEKRFKIVF